MRRLGVLALLAWAAWLVAPGVAHAQTPLPCVPPVTVCQSRPPDASPTPSPTGSRGPSPTAAPTPTPAATATFDPGFPPLPSPLPSPSGSPSQGSASPTPAASSEPPSPSPSPAPPAVTPLSLSRPFGLSAATLLLVPVGLAAFAARSRRSSSVNLNRRWQLLAGAGCIALAALVAFVGWYKIADEPLVNFQVPLLASAGMLVVLLAAVGGSLLVAEQLRAGDRRIAELEEAVRSLAEALAPYVEEPPRR